MNLPNKLTLSRIALTPVVLLFTVPLPFMPAAFNAFILTWPGRLVALFLFSAASLTDLYDGRIARAKNIVSTFGKFLDPIADKLLIISVLIAFAELNRLSSFVPVIVLFRELAITGIRLLAAEKGVVIAASRAGKWKTVTQITAVIWLLAEPILLQFIRNRTAVERTGNILIGLSLALAVWSLFMYLRSAGHYLKADTK